MGLAQRWQAACEDVASLARDAHRSPEDVRIIAVSKTVGPGVVGEGIACGMGDFGENRTQPFNEKFALYPDARWYLIGQLQSRKAKEVVGKAHLIHSLDRESLLDAIQKQAAKLGVVQDVLVEVSVSGEASKAGIAPAELPALLTRLAACENVACKGLMTMAPRGNLNLAREVFSGLRELAQDMDTEFCGHGSIAMSELSMGMSEDYAQAIAEGATMVRIGRKIFSEDFEAL